MEKSEKATTKKTDESASSVGPEQRDTRPPNVKAADIVSRLITVALLMALPLAAGCYLDQRLGTVIVFTLFGLAFGMFAAGWHLKKMLAPGGILSDEESDSESGGK